MTILIVIATGGELAPVAAELRAHPKHRIDIVTTGVGMVPAAAWCSRALTQRQYDLALNFGVCGSFDRALAPGTVVHVVADRVADLGAEDGDRLLTLEELGLASSDPMQPRADSMVNANPPASPALTSDALSVKWP